MRNVYEKLCKDLPAVLKFQWLSMTFRTMNDNHDSDRRIFMTTLVYVVYPKLPGSSPRGTVIQGANKSLLMYQDGNEA